MSASAQITILIPDPDEMMFVTGSNDQNIERIEREFAVKIVSRGAELRISGEPTSVARVGELVGAMRTLSERDESLRKPALERLIDDAKDASVGTPEQLREVVATMSYDGSQVLMLSRLRDAAQRRRIPLVASAARRRTRASESCSRRVRSGGGGGGATMAVRPLAGAAGAGGGGGVGSRSIR